MGRVGVLGLVLAVCVGVGAWWWWSSWQHEPPVPYIDPNPWWGAGQPPSTTGQAQDTAIKPFKIAIPMEAVEDLTKRLATPPRLTPGLENAKFTYGVNSETLQSVISYWRQKYNWRQREAKLNTYPHFKTNIEGLDIHFMRATPKKTDKKVVPLLLIHGWPGSFVEFYDILPYLTNPQEGNVALEVICPSIPGYGFSQGSSKQGFGHLEAAQVFLKLMKRLGYEQFYLQGGDWGSLIATAMATIYPDNVLGVHLNMINIMTPGANAKMMLGSFLPAGLVVDEKDQDMLYPMGEKFAFMLREMGYMHLQATKPDTIGAAVNQSPISLAAYIIEKFSTWTNQANVDLPDGGLLDPAFPISLDRMLDNICVYWFTNSITTSMRFYAENANKNLFVRSVDQIACRVPAGIAILPQELVLRPKNFAAHKFYDIVTYNELPAGGHFAAMERPELMGKDIINFVNIVEKRKK